MSSQTEPVANAGVGGRLNWIVGGAIGGFVGAAVFSILLWLVEPRLVTEIIPQMYRFEGSGLSGWMFHMTHGVILGIMFGFIITRNLMLGILTADVDTSFLDRLNLNKRIMGAGVVYGLFIWVFFTGLLVMVVTTIGGVEDAFPLVSAPNLTGHLLYGVILGAIVPLFIDFESEAQVSEAPFEESSDTSSNTS